MSTRLLEAFEADPLSRFCAPDSLPTFDYLPGASWAKSCGILRIFSNTLPFLQDLWFFAWAGAKV